MGKKSVYVSSTYEDLKLHRKTVIRELRGLYDVECMEDYPASDKRPTKKCLEDVERCHYFVLILGLRYGYIPAVDNPDGKSITHLEYDGWRRRQLRARVGRRPARERTDPQTRRLDLGACRAARWPAGPCEKSVRVWNLERGGEPLVLRARSGFPPNR